LKNLLNYDSPQSINAFLREKDFNARKKFGQNFLIQRWARESLLKALNAGAGDRVWEVGPGLGAMSAPLLASGAKLTAFEIDRGFCSILKDFFGDEDGFTLVEGDVLETWKPFAKSDTEVKPDYLFGNLPYNVAARVIGDFIEKGFFFKRVVVTLQKEVAQRMMAKPSTPAYSSFSVLCSSVYTVKPLPVFKSDCFYPVPNIDSQGVLLELKDTSVAGQYSGNFYPLVRSLFGARRKTVKNNLLAFIKNQNKNSSGDLGDRCSSVLNESNIDGGARAENLSVEDFKNLAQLIAQRFPG
jgi:16S rRNA (adenine1518-N6/adenine1519-N6)-dimethyltransferase